jgi:plastocyanin
MPSRLLEKASSSVLVLTLTSLIACSNSPTVSLTAEDFRFVPDLVRVTASFPLTLIVYNAGREVHEFDSPILMYSARAPVSEAITKPASTGLILEPGKSVQLAMALPRGTYFYICRRKGHANMTGTLIVE